MIARIRLRSLVILLGLLVAAGFALVVPAGYFAVFYAHLDHDLDFAAHGKASRLASFIADNRESWQRPTDRLSQVIDVARSRRKRDAPAHLRRRRQGRVRRSAQTIAPPVATATRACWSFPERRSLRSRSPPACAGSWMETALVALLSGLVGLSVFFVLRRRAAAAIIDRTLAELETMPRRAIAGCSMSAPFSSSSLDRQTRRAARRQRDRRPAVRLVARRAAGDEQQRFLSARGSAGRSRRARAFHGRSRPVSCRRCAIARRTARSSTSSRPSMPIDYRRPAGAAGDGQRRHRAQPRPEASCASRSTSTRRWSKTLPVGVLESTTDGRIVTANARVATHVRFRRRRGSQQGRRPRRSTPSRTIAGAVDSRLVRSRGRDTRRRSGVPPTRRHAVPGRALPAAAVRNADRR